MENDIQFRDYACRTLVVDRTSGDSSDRSLEGYAAVFDQLSERMFGFVEKIAPGAFTRAIKENQDVRALVDHEPSKLLGRTKSGTLSIKQDDHGLSVKIDPPDTSTGRDIVESVRRGDVDQMSFGFVIRDESVERGAGPDGLDVRTINDVDLFDVSVVTFPAYPQTDVSLRGKPQISLGLQQFRSWAKTNRCARVTAIVDRARELLLRMDRPPTVHGKSG